MEQIAQGRRGRRRPGPGRRAARRGRGRAEDDRQALADPGDRRHPLQPHAGAEGDRRRRPLHPAQPGQHRRPREGRRGRREGDRGATCRCGSASTRARCPSTCTSSSARTRSRRWSTAAVEFVEMMESLDFEDFKVSIKSTNVPNTIAANRLLSERVPYPIHLGITEAGTKWSGSLKSAVGLGHAARRRGRRHDPDQPLDLPRRGGGQGRLGDPQGAAAARARPGADRLPDLRPPAVRHGLGRRRDRAAARGLRGADRGRGARLRGERDRRGLARRLRDHRRQERGPDLRPRQAAAEGAAGRPGRRALSRDRQVARPRHGRGRRREGGRGRRVAARRSRRRTPAS